jgi:alcohol dehydrogenase class IV
MEFEFATANHIIFGRGALGRVPGEAVKMGRRVLVVTGGDLDRSAALQEGLVSRGLELETFQVVGEPTTRSVLEGAEKARKTKCDVVIGIGGGSPIDAGKAIAALVTNKGELMDYLEVIGKAQPLVKPPVPYVAIPTTAGTGAEVTRNAVIGSPERRVKVSMRSPLMLPSLAVVDPLLTVGMPGATTAATGLDALTQLIEPFVCRASNPITDSLCREGMARAARSLKRAYHNGDDVAAREEMCVASLFGGLALANAKLGAVHGFAGPIGGMFDAPHGAVCAKLLPLVIEANVHALATRHEDAPTAARFDEVARILTGDGRAESSDAVAWIKALCDELHLPSLSEFGVTTADIPLIVGKAKNAGSMKGNPVPLTEPELTGILEKAI